MKKAGAAAKREWTEGNNPKEVQVKARVVGKVVLEDLDKVKKNDWNPNEMTPFERKSLRHGIEQDGWLASHALTVWGSDEKGKTQNIIIDGEHRWEEAKALGLKQGPMVFVHGITKTKAMQLTVKLDAKRGRFNEDKLGILLRAVQEDLNLETQALDLGIDDAHLSDLLKVEDEKLSIPPADMPSGQKANVKQVPLFFQPEEHAKFMTICHELAKLYGTSTSTDTVFEAMKRAHALATAK